MKLAINHYKNPIGLVEDGARQDTRKLILCDGANEQDRTPVS